MYLKRPTNTSSGCCWYVLFLRSDKEIYIFYSVTSKPWLAVDRATGLLGQEEGPPAMEEVPDNHKAQGITAF